MTPSITNIYDTFYHDRRRPGPKAAQLSGKGLGRVSAICRDGNPRDPEGHLSRLYFHPATWTLA